MGTVVQAYLRSTEEDVRALMEEGNVPSVVQETSVEPEDCIQGFTEVQDAFANLEQMFRGGIRKVGIATHDQRLVEESIDLIQRLEIPGEQYDSKCFSA